MAATVTSPGDRVPFLEALANCDLDAYDDSDRLSALADAISAWSPASPSVAHWCQAKFPNVLVRHFQGLVLWLHRWNDNVKKVLQVAGVTDADRRSILIGGAETAGVNYWKRRIIRYRRVVGQVIGVQRSAFSTPMVFASA